MYGKKYTRQDGTPTNWDNVLSCGNYFKRIDGIKSQGSVYLDMQTGVLAYHETGDPQFFGTNKAIRCSLSKVEKAMAECSIPFKFARVKDSDECE